LFFLFSFFRHSLKRVAKPLDAQLALLLMAVAGVRPLFNACLVLLLDHQRRTLSAMALGLMELMVVSIVLLSAIAVNASNSEAIACGARVLVAFLILVKLQALWAAILFPPAHAMFIAIALLASTLPQNAAGA